MVLQCCCFSCWGAATRGHIETGCPEFSEWHTTVTFDQKILHILIRSSMEEDWYQRIRHGGEYVPSFGCTRSCKFRVSLTNLDTACFTDFLVDYFIKLFPDTWMFKSWRSYMWGPLYPNRYTSQSTVTSDESDLMSFVPSSGSFQEICCSENDW